jgi:hypothetical protein
MLYGTVAHIPLGTGRKFEIEVTDSSSSLCYYGSQLVDQLSSQTTYVLISLRLRPNPRQLSYQPRLQSGGIHGPTHLPQPYDDFL